MIMLDGKLKDNSFWGMSSLIYIYDPFKGIVDNGEDDRAVDKLEFD